MGRKKRTKQSVDEKNDEHVDDVDDMGDMEDMNLDDVVTDSEEEYTEKEKKLLEKVRKQQTTENFDSDDEVYKLQDSDTEEDEEEEEEEEDDEQDRMGSDIEGLEKDDDDDDDDVLDDKAWGGKAKTFYSSDYKYTDYATAPEKDIVNAEMEEEEGRRLHLRSMGRHVVPESSSLSQIAQLIEHSKKDQGDDYRDSVGQTSEEEEKSFMFMVNMYKNFMTEVRDVYTPFFKLVYDGTIPECEAVDFIRTRYRIILNYCTNISFCLLLRVKGIRVKGHPVINRLTQYNELLNKIDEFKQEDLLKQIADIVKAAKEGKPLYSLSDGSEIQCTKKKNKKEKSMLNSLSKNLARQKKMKKQEKYDEFDRTEEIDDKDDIETMNDEENAVLDEGKDNGEEGKRAITYEMAKNKGLTPYRKKEQRNPRVKYRNKYHKALIRRKGAVKTVRKELTRYQGEISGIKAGAIRSIKFT